MAHLNNGILCRSKREWALDTYDSTDELQKHYTELKKSDTKDYTLYDPIPVILKEAKLIYGGRTQMSSCLEPGLRKGLQEFSGVTGKFSIEYGYMGIYRNSLNHTVNMGVFHCS